MRRAITWIFSRANAFVGAGLCHPDADTLFKMREGIVRNPDAWVNARKERALSKHF